MQLAVDDQYCTYMNVDNVRSRCERIIEESGFEWNSSYLHPPSVARKEVSVRSKHGLKQINAYVLLYIHVHVQSVCNKTVLNLSGSRESDIITSVENRMIGGNK